MATTTADFAALLRENWLDGMREAFFTGKPTLQRIKRRMAKGGGEYYVQPVMSAPNFYVGPRAAGGTLPLAGEQGVKQATYLPTYHYARFKVTGPAMSASRNKGALIDALDLEMKKIPRDLMKNVNVQLFGTGSGLLAQPSSLSFSTNTSVVVDSVQYLRVGQPVVVALKSSGVIATNGAQTIGAINQTTNTITFVSTDDLSALTAATHGIYMVGGAAAATAHVYNNGIPGFLAAIYTGNPSTLHAGLRNYGGIDRSVAAGDFFKGQIFGNSSVLRSFTVDLFLDAINGLISNGNGKPDIAIVPPKLFLRVRQELEGMIRQNQGDGNHSVGSRGISIISADGGEIQLYTDFDCPPQRMLLLDTSTWEFIQDQEPDFVEDDKGAVLRAADFGSTPIHQFEGTFYWPATLGCMNPKGNGWITDLDDSLA